MKIKVTKAQYDILKQKVLLPLPVFLQYMAAEYPEYDKKTCYDFYLKTRALVLEQPLFLHCELTADCNLDCKMCYVHIEKEAIKKRQHEKYIRKKIEAKKRKEQNEINKIAKAIRLSKEEG